MLPMPYVPTSTPLPPYELAQAEKRWKIERRIAPYPSQWHLCTTCAFPSCLATMPHAFSSWASNTRCAGGLTRGLRRFAAWTRPAVVAMLDRHNVRGRRMPARFCLNLSVAFIRLLHGNAAYLRAFPVLPLEALPLPPIFPKQKRREAGDNISLHASSHAFYYLPQRTKAKNE